MRGLSRRALRLATTTEHRCLYRSYRPFRVLSSDSDSKRYGLGYSQDKKAAANPVSKVDLRRDTKLHNFLRKVSYGTAGGLFVTAATSALTISMLGLDGCMELHLPLWGGSGIVMLGSAVAIDLIKPVFGNSIWITQRFHWNNDCSFFGHYA